MNIVEQAREFAISKHAGQRYGKLPYAYHLQQVVSKLINWRDLGQWEITDTHLVVGWLHDVLEVTDATYEDLELNFGDDVAYEVRLLSKLGGISYNFYISCIKDSMVAFRVKMADTICNLEASILSGEMKRVNKYSKQLALLLEE